MREASAVLEEETRRQETVQARLREENQRLAERAEVQARRCQRDQDAEAELQAALKQVTSAHAQLVQRLAEEENSRKELQKTASELQAKLTAVQEERATLGRQLHLEREVHQKELQSVKATVEDSRTKKDREVQDMLKLCGRERDETQALLKEVKVVYLMIMGSMKPLWNLDSKCATRTIGYMVMYAWQKYWNQPAYFFI